MVIKVETLSELVEKISEIQINSGNFLVFRGEKKDYGETALQPYVYRDNYIKHEDVIYRECQRFNNVNFDSDKSVFDKLSRIQHYSAPTRLIDVSEDLFSSVYFSIAEKDVKNDGTDAVLYAFEIDSTKIKHYDSDTVSVISNLAKMPLKGEKKSKEQLVKDINNFSRIEQFNKQESVQFLLHEIKEEKPYFSHIIDPSHLMSIQFVLPKLTNNRIRSQKGAFLLFGLNSENCEKPIKLLELLDENKSSNDKISHPIVKLHTFILKHCCISGMQQHLIKMGIKTPFIYPEIDKVSEHLVKQYK